MLILLLCRGCVQVKTPIVGNLLFTPAEADAVNRVFSSNDVPLSVPTDFVAGAPSTLTGWCRATR